MEPAFDEKGKPVMVEVKDKKGNVKLNKVTILRCSSRSPDR